jgi:23S rRNA (adenine2503-C2)-methyltransferase
MRIVAEFGTEGLATVYVASVRENGHGLIEFVESTQPPIPRERKWVLIVSTLLGCPVGCAICDAGGWYGGKLEADEILAQILYMVDRRFPGREVPVPKLKIQFARMGEPSFNPGVTEALDRLPELLRAPGLLPSVSSVAPAGTEPFFEELLRVKNSRYDGGRFLPFGWMASYGRRFRRNGDQKITLNFPAARGVPVDPEKVGRVFSPDEFLIKLTPVNPTARAGANRITSRIDPERPETGRELQDAFEREGFRVLLSIGETEENAIGSNCGMFVSETRDGRLTIREGYSTRRYARAEPEA